MNITRKTRIKQIVILVSLVLLVFSGTGIALSYISDSTEPIVNTLAAGEVSCLVEGSFDGSKKTDVTVRNTGTTSAYIRAALAVNWQSDTDTYEILARAPREGVDYEILYGSSLWVLGDDGFWYYTEPVDVDESTALLIEKISVIGDVPDGYSLSVDIAASAVQAQPASVVEEVWGVSLSGSTLIP